MSKFSSESATWVDFNTSATIPVGTKVTIQNVSSCSLFVQTSPTIPNSLLTGFILEQGQYVVIKSGSEKIWVMSSGIYSIQIEYVLGDLGNYIDNRVYDGLKAFTVQSFSEANSKNGTQFVIDTRLASVAAGATFDAIITTGSKPVLTKNLYIQFTGSLIETVLYKGVVATGGNPFSSYSLNTDSYPTMLSTFRSNNPTAFTLTDTGTQVSPSEFFYGVADQGNKAIPSLIIGGAERVLAPNTSYLRRVWNRGASSCVVDLSASFYEGELSSQN